MSLNKLRYTINRLLSLEEFKEDGRGSESIRCTGITAVCNNNQIKKRFGVSLNMFLINKIIHFSK